MHATDLITSTDAAVLTGGALWIDYWVRAGSGAGSGGRRSATLQDPVLAPGTAGSVVPAMTSDRQLVAYQEYRRRLWSLALGLSSAPVQAGRVLTALAGVLFVAVSAAVQAG